MNWYKISQTVPQIPPITNGCIRLTHFTGPSSSGSVLGGEDFRFSGLLDSTTDSFTDDNHVSTLLSTGSIGAFSRGGFGMTVILMDMPNEIHKQIRNGEGDIIPNNFVVGVFDRKNNTFSKNPKFNPSKKISIPQRKDPMEQRGKHLKETIPVMAPSSQTPTIQNKEDVF